MQQYQRLRASIPLIRSFFSGRRFLRAVFEDAKEASGLLNLRAHHRNSVPMCGHAVSRGAGYIRSSSRRRRVAVCDQTSEPQPGKIVTREITQIITAGTVSGWIC